MQDGIAGGAHGVGEVPVDFVQDKLNNFVWETLHVSMEEMTMGGGEAVLSHVT